MLSAPITSKQLLLTISRYSEHKHSTRNSLSPTHPRTIKRGEHQFAISRKQKADQSVEKQEEKSMENDQARATLHNILFTSYS